MTYLFVEYPCIEYCCENPSFITRLRRLQCSVIKEQTRIGLYFCLAGPDVNLAYVLEDQERKDAEKLGESDKSREANGSTSKHAYDNNSIELEESGERKKEMEADDPPDYEVVIGAPKTSVEVQADFPMNEEDTDLKL